MKEREKLHLPTLLSVDALNSMYHFDLTNKVTQGELHDFYELVWVEQGFYYVILDGERIVVPPGSCIVFAPNAFHSGDGTTQATATVSIVSFDSGSAAMQHFGNRVFTPNEQQHALWARFFADCSRFCEQRGRGVYPLEHTGERELQVLKAELELFLLSLYAEEGHVEASNRKQYRKESFARIAEYVKDHLAEQLRLSDIAVACSVSETALKSLCREFCGCGPIEYLISVRVATAKRLIRQSGMTFTEIAVATGFGGLHYFSRVFRARTGMTPTEYAKAP